MDRAFADQGDFSSFLFEVAANRSKDNEHLAARNFLLDERVSKARADHYVAHCATPHSIYMWKTSHRNYDKQYVDLPNPSSGGRLYRIDLADQTTCPSTFLDNTSTYGRTDENLALIRVWSVRTLANIARMPVNDVLDSFEEYLKDPQNPQKILEVDDLLYGVTGRLTIRPVFAGFYAELRDELKQPEWQNHLRDSLGLTYYQGTSTSPFPVVVFKYPVKAVAEIHGQPDVRPFAPPTVIEAGLYSAFCPSPATLSEGRTVHLSGNVGNFKTEIVHGFTPLQAKHLYRIGQVTNRPPVGLEVARGWHIVALRDAFGRDDFGEDTDDDIIATL